MNDALVVMNPRTIPECMRAFEELAIPKIYLRGFTEKEISDYAFREVLGLGFDWLWLVSDDAIVHQAALNAVRDLAKAGHPVCTGYSQRSHTEWVVNLTKGPISGAWPSPESYDFYEFKEVISWPTPELRTWFTGMSLTGMSTELWKQYPFTAFGDPGCASDFSLSQRLQAGNVPIMAAREAFCYHWRHDWITTNNEHDQDPVVESKTIVKPVNVENCDAYRRSYNDAPFESHKAFYDWIAKDYPDQSYASLELIDGFLTWSGASSVIEIGGWDGRAAGAMLQRHPLTSWRNYEIANVRQVCLDPRYQGIVLDGWLWEREEPLEADALVASHVLEHLSVEHLSKLLNSVTCQYMYVDVPLPDEPYDWMGSLTTHVIPLSIWQFDELLERHGWHVVRSFQREDKIPSYVRYLTR